MVFVDVVRMQCITSQLSPINVIHRESALSRAVYCCHSRSLRKQRIEAFVYKKTSARAWKRFHGAVIVNVNAKGSRQEWWLLHFLLNIATTLKLRLFARRNDAPTRAALKSSARYTRAQIYSQFIHGILDGLKTEMLTFHQNVLSNR